MPSNLISQHFLPPSHQMLKGNVVPAAFGELAEYAKLRAELRQRILAENQARGLFHFSGGAYSFNLEAWLDLRTSELVSVSA